MPGYLYAVSLVVAKDASAQQGKPMKSPVVTLETFKRKAVEAFEAKIVSLKKTGVKLGEVKEFDLVPYEQTEETRSRFKEVTGTDKDGKAVILFLERFRVGGQLEQRRAEQAAEEG